MRALLVSLSALILCAMLPAMSQATTAQAPAGSALAVGAAIEGKSSNWVTQTSAGNLSCTSGIMNGKMTSNGGSDVTASITNETFSGCTGPLGVTVDIKTNATAAAPWTLQIQQPSGEVSTAHLSAASGGVVQFTVQPQVFGFSTTTCDYSETITSTWQINLGFFHYSHSTTRQSGSAEQCGTPGTVDGGFTFTSGGNNLTIDMS